MHENLKERPKIICEIIESKGYCELINEYASVHVRMETNSFLTKKEALKILNEIKEKVDKRVAKELQKEAEERAKRMEKLEKVRSKIDKLQQQYGQSNDEDEKELIDYQIKGLEQLIRELEHELDIYR